MEETLSGIVTDVNLEQSWNDLVPIVVTLPGIVMFVKLIQSLNRSSEISLMLSDKIIDVNFEQH